MRWLTQLRMRLAMLFQRSTATAYLDSELRFHLDQQIGEYIAAGMNPQEARQAAMRSFGNPTLLRDQTRATWSWHWLESLLRDIRYGARTLWRTPGFSLVAIAVMALCIGAATSLFTVVRSVLLKPLPFRDPDRLVMVYERHRMNQFPIQYTAASPGDYYDWRAQTHGFEDMAAWEGWSQFNLSGEQAELPEVIHAGAATPNFFPLLGVQPALGRTFAEADDHWGADTVVLTWSLFERRFGADPSILGKQVHLDAKPYTVVGVLPKWFTFPDAKVQLWVPYQSITPPQFLHHHAFHQTRVIARMKPGVSLTDAIEQVGAVQYRLHMQFPDQAVCEGAVSRSLNDDLARDVKKPLILLLCAVTCMLLIGCLNVANLLVARGAARQKEVAIRGALGAQRLTLIREQLTESLLLCFAGGVVGVLLSLAATKWMAHAWKNLPSAEDIHADGVVLAFACLLIFVTALLAGLLPAISATGKTVLATLQASSRAAGSGLSRTSLRRSLLAVEIGVTVVLLIAAGLLLKSFVRMRTTDLGCAMDHVLTMVYSLPKQKYDTPQKIVAFHESLLDKLAAMPGVRAVGLGETVPGTGEVEDDIFTIPEHPPQKAGGELLDALVRRADPGYFNALQIPLLSGRFFTRQDVPDPTNPDRRNKIIINRIFARQFFPGEDPIGKHLQVLLWNDTKYEIVGVVADTLHQVNAPARPTMYFPALSGSDPDGTLVIRTIADPDPIAFSIPVQKQIAALDPELPVSNVLTMQQIVGESLTNASFSATLVLAFAVLSLLLASVGLYGVLSYLMTQRTTEIGIRIALGAQREQVLRLVLLDGLRPAIFGLLFGLAVSAGATRLIQSMLYGTRPLDPAVFGAVAATLLLVAIVACIVPAWRASRLDPMQALRTE
jgi:putative ABC transport system permease protein